MKFISLFSGIDAASVAWNPLGMEAIAFSEIEPFPCTLLQHYYPSVPNLGDITKADWSKFKGTDIVIGGSPCQSFSLAGLRQGLNDERGNLTLTYAQTIRTILPRYFVWENVRNVLSDKGNAFGCLLAGLLDFNRPIEPVNNRWGNSGFIVGDRYSIAWRVLDSQDFGVQQRRKRVWLVGYRHDGDKNKMGVPAAILFEPVGDNRTSEKIETNNEQEIKVSKENPLFFSSKQRLTDVGFVSPTLVKIGKIAITDGENVRLLTDEETESLQGFPRGFTAIPYRGKIASGEVRRAALGNSFSVPVVRWIGERILKYNRLL